MANVGNPPLCSGVIAVPSGPKSNTFTVILAVFTPQPRLHHKGLISAYFRGMHYMLAHHIVVQHKLNEHCLQRLVSSTHFSKLLFSVLSTPRLSFLSFYVLLCTYSSSSVPTSPFLSLLVLLCPH